MRCRARDCDGRDAGPFAFCRLHYFMIPARMRESLRGLRRGSPQEEAAIELMIETLADLQKPKIILTVEL